MREFEARALRVDQRAFLLDVLAEHLTQRRHAEVRAEWFTFARRRDACPPAAFTYRRTRSTPGALPAVMAEHLGLDLLRIVDANVPAGPASSPDRRPPPIGVERRAVEHHYARIACAQLCAGVPSRLKRHHAAGSVSVS